MNKNSLLSEDNDLTKYSSRNDQEIVMMQSAMRYKTIKNNLQLVMILNMICLIGNTFAMAFYQWFLIILENQNEPIRIWLNLLYVFEKHQEKYMSYKTYEESPKSFCNYIHDMTQKECLRQLNLLENTGIFCFCCIMLSLAFLSYDIIRLKHLLRAFQQQTRYESKIKGVLVYSVITISQAISLIVYLLATILLPSLREIETHFGTSYWVSWSCCILIFVFALYYRWSKGRFLRFQIMEKLINQELSEDTINNINASHASL